MIDHQCNDCACSSAAIAIAKGCPRLETRIEPEEQRLELVEQCDDGPPLWPLLVPLLVPLSAIAWWAWKAWNMG